MRNIPTVTKNLLILNILAFIAGIMLSRMGIDLNNILGLHFFLANDFHLWQIYNLYVYAWQFYAHSYEYVYAVDVWYGDGKCVGTKEVLTLLYRNWYWCWIMPGISTICKLYGRRLK